MPILTIYGDEAGNMPLKDTDLPFTVGSVATFNELAADTDRSRQLTWTLSRVQSVHPGAFVAYVQPHTGYSKALFKRHSRLDTMARFRRLQTGAHRYLADDGIRSQNLIWIECMEFALFHMISHIIYLDRIDGLRIVLHRKTLAASSARFLRDTLPGIHTRLLGIAEGIEETDANMGQAIRERIAFDPLTVDLAWGDTNERTSDGYGVHLAHCVASNALRSLRKNQLSDFEKHIQPGAVKKSLWDLTDMMTRPLDPKSIARWEKDTGLRAPQ